MDSAKVWKMIDSKIETGNGNSVQEAANVSQNKIKAVASQS